MGYLESEQFSVVRSWRDKIKMYFLTALKMDLKSQRHHVEQFYISYF